MSHPIRVIKGKQYSDYPAATHISAREWLALGAMLVGFLVWAAAMVGGLWWLVAQVVQRWR